jgi:hypothetical protein
LYIALLNIWSSFYISFLIQWCDYWCSVSLCGFLCPLFIYLHGFLTRARACRARRQAGLRQGPGLCRGLSSPPSAPSRSTGSTCTTHIGIDIFR